jgi:hypothetical protein
MQYFRREDSQISVGVHQSALHRYDDEFGADHGFAFDGVGRPAH